MGMKIPQTCHTIFALREQLASWRAEGASIGLVPTMGALHEGHLSLVRATAKRAQRVVVSIFVNPTQFAPHEDFETYPRTLDDDREKLAACGAADLIFAPSAAEMYPPGFATSMSMGGPGLGLETDFRPHFFGGVAIVVAKLLIAALPDIAMFGEKDYQQLLVIRRMAADLGLPIEIAGAPILRESDGLAMSSRNAYLSSGERKVAGQLNLILTAAIARLKKGDAIGEVGAAAETALKEAGFDSVDYVAVRDAQSLAQIENLSQPARILAAAKIGKTRLIDNMAV
jgi:pantoate--beta-alanine ligase